MGFDFTSEERRKLGYKLIDRIDAYFSSLHGRSVQLPAEQRTFGHLRDSMPELGEDASRILDDVCTELIDKGFHVPSANYFGLMNPTPTYMSVLAEALVAALNPQLATLARSQLASKIESETVRWIAERVGWHKKMNGEVVSADKKVCDGTFTSGGNEANFTAIALALTAHFPDVVEDGVATIGARPVGYASAESHHSLDKSFGLLGLGRKALRRVPVNDSLQLDPAKLVAQIEADIAAGFRPFIIIATAGTTNSGAIDDIQTLADIAARYSLWFHVDGAYGAAAVFSNKHRGLVTGIERADSITMDPHKWLSMPFAAGVILTSRPEMLERAFAVTTPYMPKVVNAPLIDNFKVSAQWSRRMNSLKLWLTLRVHGREAYETLIDRQLTMARNFVDWVNQSEHFELAAPQVLPIVNFRLKNAGDEKAMDAANQALIEAVTRDGKLWISKTHVAGRCVLRMMVISYLSDEHNLDALKSALTAAAEQITSLKVAGSRR